jgi:hypothetical protein
MSVLINLPALCASLSLAKRLKSGNKSAAIEEWDSETNGWPPLLNLQLINTDNSFEHP